MTRDAAQRPESVEEGLALLDYHFFPAGDPASRYLRADSFKENVIRLIVFDMHLAVEELLRAHIFDALSQRSQRRGETVRYVEALSSRQALDLAAQLGVIDGATYGRLRDLNRLRNRAAHHWDVDDPLRHRSSAAAEHDRLSWDGGELTPDRVRSEFLSAYGDIYAGLLESWREAHPEQAGRAGAAQDGHGR
ncbi:MAG TPA: hypothetical protein VNV44_13125 [Solirubrobacteraceae bacterium]|jgi:hypothetical protein|nr:hypothetical protein [Solirubrobacteraceae bacterium]